MSVERHKEIQSVNYNSNIFGEEPVGGALSERSQMMLVPKIVFKETPHSSKFGRFLLSSEYMNLAAGGVLSSETLLLRTPFSHWTGFIISNLSEMTFSQKKCILGCSYHMMLVPVFISSSGFHEYHHASWPTSVVYKLVEYDAFFSLKTFLTKLLSDVEETEEDQSHQYPVLSPTCHRTVKYSQQVRFTKQVEQTLSLS